MDTLAAYSDSMNFHGGDIKVIGVYLYGIVRMNECTCVTLILLLGRLKNYDSRPAQADSTRSIGEIFLALELPCSMLYRN